VSDVRILEARWYVLRNDLIGGWAVATCEAEALSECPARLGCCVVADLFTESVAHYIVDLHNATIGTSHTTTLEAEIASLRARVAELTERAEDAEACAVGLAQALEDVLPLVHTPRHVGDEAECNRPTCLLGRRLIAAVRAQYDEGQVDLLSAKLDAWIDASGDLTERLGAMEAERDASCSEVASLRARVAELERVRSAYQAWEDALDGYDGQFYSYSPLADRVDRLRAAARAALAAPAQEVES